MNKIREKNQEIRNFCNLPRINCMLWTISKKKYSQLCSCLDIIDGTQIAIDLYSNVNESCSNIGEFYLQVYGLFQILFVQQDAVFDMSKALGVKEDVKDYPMLKDIREKRNYSIGHPSDYNYGESFNTIINNSLDKKHFDVFSYNKKAELEIINIDIMKIIEEQKINLLNVLCRILENIEKKDKEYRQQFRNIKLIDCFIGKDNIIYSCEKLSQSLRQIEGSGYFILGETAIKLIKLSIDDFKSKLLDRNINIDFYSELGYLINELEHPIDQIYDAFNNKTLLSQTEQEIKTLIVFSKYIWAQIDKLIDFAKKIDDEYEC